jgi:hypothetical protein
MWQGRKANYSPHPVPRLRTVQLHIQFSIPFYNTALKYLSTRTIEDRLCGIVVRDPGYRYRVPGSIPGATTFSKK